MALRTTPTIAICLTAAVAAGIALARPADQAPPAAAPVAEAAAPAEVTTVPANDSPYLVDGETAPIAEGDSGADTAAPPAAPSPVAISIEGFAFTSTNPVAPGSPIAVTNLDGSPHTLTATNGEFNTGTLGQDESANFAAPTAPGTYEFFCVIHPSMTGQLVVS